MVQASLWTLRCLSEAKMQALYRAQEMLFYIVAIMLELFLELEIEGVSDVLFWQSCWKHINHHQDRTVRADKPLTTGEESVTSHWNKALDKRILSSPDKIIWSVKVRCTSLCMLWLHHAQELVERLFDWIIYGCRWTSEKSHNWDGSIDRQNLICRASSRKCNSQLWPENRKAKLNKDV